MPTKLYANHKNGNTYLVSQNLEKDAAQAQMTIKEYVAEMKRINPQFVKVYTL